MSIDYIQLFNIASNHLRVLICRRNGADLGSLFRENMLQLLPS